MAAAGDARAALLRRVRNRPPAFVHVSGTPLDAQVEPERDLERLDHVWLSIQVAPFGLIRAVINTVSRIHRAAGFDSRIRLGLLRGTWSQLPPPGIKDCTGFAYETIEAANNLFYEHYEREPLTQLLLEKMGRTIHAEAWGDLYARDHLGLHQIHSRRNSAAVRADIIGRDGALMLYSGSRETELLLFKFTGQP
jgi:hypothetical protein